ncbi:Transcriptional regulator [Pseudomonas chlororaphis]
MPAPHFVIDSLAIAKATPKRRHVDLKVSLTAALNEFVELGLFETMVSPEGLTTWSLIGGPIVAQEDFYEDTFKRQFVLTRLTRDAVLGVVLRARHSGDRAALIEALRKG